MEQDPHAHEATAHAATRNNELQQRGRIRARHTLLVLYGVSALALIGLLIAVLSMFHMTTSHPRAAQVKSTLQMLEMALTLYKSDLGVYPDDTRPVDVFNVLTGYRRDPVHPDPVFTKNANWRGPYFKADAIFFRNQAMNQELLDLWQQPYRMRLQKPLHNKFTVDIWSTGPNRKDDNGNGDDITNW